MSELLHAAAAAPAALAACCTLAERRIQAAAAAGAVLMAASMVFVATRPGAVAPLLIGALASWVAALLAAVELQRSTALTPRPWVTGRVSSARHRLLGSITMAVLMMAMAFGHADLGAGTTWSPVQDAHAVHHHTGNSDGLTLVAAFAAAAYCVHSGHLLWRHARARRRSRADGPHPVAPQPLALVALVEIVAMTAMTALLGVASLI